MTNQTGNQHIPSLHINKRRFQVSLGNTGFMDHETSEFDVGRRESFLSYPYAPCMEYLVNNGKHTIDGAYGIARLKQ